MQTHIRISTFLLVALSLTAGHQVVSAAGQQSAPTSRAAVVKSPKIKRPAPAAVMGPVQWLPDPVESPLKSATIPILCTEVQGVVGQAPSTSPHLLDCWLEANPAVAKHILFNTPNMGHIAWPAWPETRKADLREAFWHAWQWHDNGLTNYPGYTFAEPIENMETPYVNQQPYVRTVLDEDLQAWPLYTATTGHVLAAEIFGFVPWSIRDMSDEALDILLSMPEQMYRDSQTQYPNPAFRLYGESTPAHPAYTYKFLVDNNLIGATQTETIERVLDWARWNLVHFGGQYSWDNLFHTWGYYGEVPVSRVIEGTVLTHPEYENNPWGHEIHHWTAGCYGTVRFLANVLRLANIPVGVRSAANLTNGHTMPYFASIGRYLTHGDDPYSQESKGFVAFPARQMLIDQTMWNAWFANAPIQQMVKNVGRRTMDLSIFYPSPYVLELHCSDQANQLSHAASKVAEMYADLYTVDQLEDMQLWQRLDKAAMQYGCAM
jgi:hypothetical protein